MRIFAGRDVIGCLVLAYIVTALSWLWSKAGEDPDYLRAWSTRQLMGSLAFQLELVRQERGSYPDGSDWLHWVSTVDAPYGSPVRDKDSWGSKLVYRKMSSDSYRLVSCGSDRQCLGADAMPELAENHPSRDIVIESGAWARASSAWANSDIVIEYLDEDGAATAAGNPVLGVRVSRLGNAAEAVDLRVIQNDDRDVGMRFDGCDEVTRPLYGMSPPRICVVQFEENNSLERAVFIHYEPVLLLGNGGAVNPSLGGTGCNFIVAEINPPYDIDYRNNVLRWCPASMPSVPSMN